ncbi:MAG TPA: hypothetical protein VGO16_10935 [Pseudonocardiaceae bacterium]|nr:hypothetical protein [Pseudonocardiaceae bacterium]
MRRRHDGAALVAEILGPALALGTVVTVDSGKVHAPTLAWDPASKKLYAA